MVTAKTKKAATIPEKKKVRALVQFAKQLKLKCNKSGKELIHFENLSILDNKESK